MFYKGKKVLVTGGGDLIGSHIVQELLKQDAKVRVVEYGKPIVLKDSRIEILNGDLTKKEDCLRAVEGIDYVFHAAGVTVGAAVTTGNPEGAMESMVSNLILTARMLQAAWLKNVERFLLFSSSAVYPVADYAIKEEEVWNGPPHQSYFGYGWMRRYFEKLGEFVGSKSDVKIAIIRPTTTYGRGDNFDPITSQVIPALIKKAAEKQNPYTVWGTGEEVRDFIHASDLARACLLILEKHAICDPVNIGSGNGTKIKEIVKIILEAADYENANVIFDSSKPSTIPFRIVDASKATKLLGFTPRVSLEEGLRDMFNWYAKKNELIN